MTDTDLITAGESTDGKPSDAAATDPPDLNADEPAGSLATMVLPELRALANRAGVKGTSGMRKNELIAAIEEIRRQANGAPAVDRSAQDTTRATGRPVPRHRPPRGNRPRPNRSIPKANRSARSGAAPPVKRDPPAPVSVRAQPQTTPTTAKAVNRTPRPRSVAPTRVATKGVTSRLRAVSRRAATRTEKRVRAGADAGSAIGGAAVNDPATAPRLNCVRTTSSSR
ncbi:transcription termination factor Rho [Mycobacterium tuberculosis]|nr:transcription termination factor Rho [Mycobacterium tuberculosis]